MSGVLDDPLPPDDLRCKRTDGRDWRCKRPSVDGKSFCLSHLYRGQKQPPPPPPPPVTPLPTPPNPTSTSTKPKVRIRVKVKPKPEPLDDFGLDGPTPLPHPPALPELAGPLPDHLRCTRNDGRSWRCKKAAMVGQNLCEAHFNQAKAKALAQRKPKNTTTTTATKTVIDNEKKKKKKKKKGEEEGGGGGGEVDERFRCGKKKGKAWRCKKKVVEGEVFCEAHLRSNVKNNAAAKRKKECCEEISDSLRCLRTDGKEWRCKKRVLEGESFCESHFKRIKVKKGNVGGGSGSSKKGVKGNVGGGTHVVIKEERIDDDGGGVGDVGRVANGEVTVAVGGKGKDKEKEKEKGKGKEVGFSGDGGEEDTRCKRTDGRGWRCKRKVVEGRTLCEIHYEQGRLRQLKLTVPEELKIQRGDGGEKAGKKLKRKRELEILENNSDKGMKRMKAELIRVFLRREILENNKKKTEKRNSKVSEEVTRDLPFGFMAIPPAPSHQILDNAASLGIKIGAHCSNNLVTRRFRSKNIEPLPISSMKVVPYPGKSAKPKGSGRKKCHWCRKFDNLCLIQCTSCRKRHFCSNCIKERSADPEEVKLRCPVCRGSCECKACCTNRSKDTGAKEVLKENFKGSKFQHLQYLINYLLPILVQINQEQSVELEMEAEFKGQSAADVEIRQADVGCREQCCCNNCKSPILDFHRSCPNCSYNLCLSCCREYSQGGSLGGTSSNKKQMLVPLMKECSKKSVDVASSVHLPDPTACLQISCPPMELGGCDNSLLDLRCIFPLNWTKELEISAKEMASEHDFLHNADDSVSCSLCTSIFQGGNKNKELKEASRRVDSNDNFLYCPSTSDDYHCQFVHFQKHWRKGHPIKVRNVLQCVTALSLDALAMFCSYVENGYSNCKNSKDAFEAPSCSDSYEVEIGSKESFIGSMKEGYRHIRCETLKLKAKISSAFSRKLLEGYYNDIIHSLPLLEYTNPRVGLLNIAGKLPEDFPDSKLGPHVCISYGSREEVARGELVTKLCCNSYDVVNILVHVGNALCTTEQLNKIKKLVKRNNNLKEKEVPASNDDLEDEETRLHSEISVEAGEQLRVAGASCCSAAANDVFAANNVRDDKSSAAKLINCSDTDSDASMICSRTSHSPNKSVDQVPPLNNLGSLNVADKQPPQEPCGALWDVFRRQDSPKLLEYITKHEDELRFNYGLSDNVIHPIFDGSFYLDATHKMQLKEEFAIEPWSFNQCLGEAVFIPAGCPYQIRSVKSCVSITSGFVSPENASECIKLTNEIRVLPNNHKAKQVKLEVEKMAICSIDEAIKELYRLKSEEGSR